MAINSLVKGDIFEVLRNGRRYSFERYPIELKPRDLFAKHLETGVMTAINMQTKIKIIKRANDDLNQCWYFTFRSGHKHHDRYLKVTGDKSFAKEIAKARFGKGIASVYSESEFTGGNPCVVDWFNLQEIK
mgnify:CR=1 FL=1